MRAKSFEGILRDKTRRRMAALRRASKSREAAAVEQRRSSLTGDASKWRITNLARVLEAMG